MRTNIYIYTSLYPFSLMAESFLGEELRVGSTLGINITIIPVGKDKYKRELPKNVRLDESICNRGFLAIFKATLRLLKPAYLKEIIYNKKRTNSLRYRLDTIKYLFAASLVYNDIKKRATIDEPSVFYGYWLTFTPIAFAEYKRKYKGSQHLFISRAHTFSSFEDSPGVYYPLRDFVFDGLDRIYVISNVLLKRLEKVYPQHINKMELARLGVVDNYTLSCEKTGYVEIVSCSSIIPLKRVDLIFDSINEYAKNHRKHVFRWTHIGDGPLMLMLHNITEQHREDNLVVELKGALPNKDILEMYRKRRFNAFILLSVTEGVPVVIMEAISSGIPVLATNVGAVSDIVTSQTGKLIKKQFTYEEFEEALDSILGDLTLSYSSHEFFLANYESTTNYSNFYKSLIKD